MTDTTRILVAEGHERTRTNLLAHLSADGFDARRSQTEAETRLKLRTQEPELLILGAVADPPAVLALLRAIRSAEAGCEPGLAVIALGDSPGGLELLRAFEAGADHYMGRPVPYLEVRARVRACAKRMRGWGKRRRLSVGRLTVDRDQRQARFAGQELELSRMEFAFLAHLSGSPARVFTKHELLREVWGYKSEGRTRTVDAHACRLRRKLAAVGAREHVVSVRGVGYRLLERVSDSLRDGGEATVVSIEGAHLAA